MRATRVDLAGGTLDLWPIYAVLGKAYTINAAIDLCAEVTIDLEVDEVSGIQISDANGAVAQKANALPQALRTASTRRMPV